MNIIARVWVPVASKYVGNKYMTDLYRVVYNSLLCTPSMLSKDGFTIE